jgi:hypothetical protein
VCQSGTQRPDVESVRLGIFKYTHDKVVSNFQSSLRDWSCRDEYPALRAGLSSAVPAGLSSIQPDGWSLFSKCYSNSAEFRQLGISCIALTQEKIEVAALVGLQYGILK